MWNPTIAPIRSPHTPAALITVGAEKLSCASGKLLAHMFPGSGFFASSNCCVGIRRDPAARDYTDLALTQPPISRRRMPAVQRPILEFVPSCARKFSPALFTRQRSLDCEVERCPQLRANFPCCRVPALHHMQRARHNDRKERIGILLPGLRVQCTQAVTRRHLCWSLGAGNPG